MAYETIAVAKHISLKQIATAGHVPHATLIALNPELRKGILPPNEYRLKVPMGMAISVARGIENAKPIIMCVLPKRHRKRVHTVKRGDNITRIARKYHTPAESIMTQNRIRKPDELRIGTILIIPPK